MVNTPRIFVTGVTGYLGGHTVLRIVEQHPEWHIVALVRNQEQKEIILARWPQVETVLGDLDNRELLLLEASKADVVLQTGSADHVPGVLALIEGLSKNKVSPGRMIHVGGTGLLHDVTNGYGQPSDKIYHDIADLAEIVSFPLEGHAHRDVDMAIMEAQEKFKVDTAILAPPAIYGVGKGPIKTRSIQVPSLAAGSLTRGKVFQVLEGQNIWDLLHIDDAAAAFILLVEEALKPNGGRAQWGSNGYYFAEGGEFKWADVSAAVSKILYQQGVIDSEEVDKLSVADATAIHPWAALLWGGNCRSRSDRLHQLGWKAQGPSLYETLPAMLAEEVKNLGKHSSKLTLDK